MGCFASMNGRIGQYYIQHTTTTTQPLHTAYKSEEIQTTSSKLNIEGVLIVAKSRGLVAQLPSNFPMVLSQPLC